MWRWRVEHRLVLANNSRVPQPACPEVRKAVFRVRFFSFPLGTPVFSPISYGRHEGTRLGDAKALSSRSQGQAVSKERLPPRVNLDTL